MIKKELHQIWLGDMPEHIQRTLNNTKKLFKSHKWKYNLWTFKDLINNKFIESDELNSILALDSIDTNLKLAMIADIARYRIIHTYGGFYADADTVFVKIIPAKLLKYNLVVGYGDEYKKEKQKLLINGVFGSENYSEFLEYILYNINFMFKTFLKQQDYKPWKVTGPLLFTNCFNQYKGLKDDYIVLDKEIFCPFSSSDKIELDKITEKTICYTYWNHKLYK